MIAAFAHNISHIVKQICVLYLCTAANLGCNLHSLSSLVKLLDRMHSMQLAFKTHSKKAIGSQPAPL